MIVVIGRPGLGRSTRIGEDGEALSGLAAAIAIAASATGSRVELVGSVGDDGEGDIVVVHLGRAGVGHAALIRDPAGRTPVDGEGREPAPRLDAADIELGLRYLADIPVLVIAEPLGGDAVAEALTAAAYHGASVICVVPNGAVAPADLAEASTVLEAPDGATDAFAEMVGRFAAAIDGGAVPSQAFADATRAVGWEPAAG